MFFVSHCDNSGRSESISYNVPLQSALYCVPLFADQIHSAAIVKRETFGVIKEKQMCTQTMRGAKAEACASADTTVIMLLKI